MTNKISLTASMRNNLSSLQNISRQVSDTQNRLSTGKKVNAAIDNPGSYYTARSLDNRANDLNALLDSMGQAVQTIKTATTGLEAGANFLEQAAAIANQALENPVQAEAAGNGAANPAKSIEELEAEGYRVVSTAADLQAAVTAGAKIALGSDITLGSTLNITAADVVIDGNGHELTYKASAPGEAAITVDGSGASAEIKNLGISVSGEQVYGIAAKNGGRVSLDNTQGIEVSGTGARKLWFRDEALYDGKANTQVLRELIAAGGNYPAAALTSGDWYLPSIGELMNVYGTNTSAMTSGSDTTGATGTNKTIINNTLSILANNGVDATTLTNGYYWSSSERNSTDSWRLDMTSGARNATNAKSSNDSIRSFQLVENCFNPSSLSDGATAPKIGDVIYADKTYSSADNYDGSKTAIGVVTEVIEDGSVKIMALKNAGTSTWGSYGTDTPLDNYDYAKLLNAAKSGGTIEISFTPSSADGGNGTGTGVDSSWQDRFNGVLSQYDMLIEDSSYKGINLLRNDDLQVVFNEARSSLLNVSGKDASSAALGLNAAEWKTFADVAQSLKEISSALNKIRSMSSELGNNYSIVLNRQDFTENLINVLTEGSDKLTLADMNEESANMLALQTRQQLAVNSLSLASQASQAILKLF